ncbi:hypothetical protein HOY82DRAFT_612863 [Tuber indicum]|nr:hypothetical protein HOY82DRAFT_612863 [Tuber indicum]
MQDPRIQQLKTAHSQLRKKINDLLEAHKDAVADPRLTPNAISALSAELDRKLQPMLGLKMGQDEREMNWDERETAEWGAFKADSGLRNSRDVLEHFHS